jgi:isoleucyl-tRNA synthetase
MENAIEGKDFNFAEQEHKILDFWKEIDAFKQQLKRTEGCKEYVFFDGPPFATGLPHYGHILAGTIKVCVAAFRLSGLVMKHHDVCTILRASLHLAAC